MAKIDLIYEAVDDFGLITSAEAADLGMSRAEMVQQEDTTGVPETLPTRFGARCDHEARDGNMPRAPRRNSMPAHP